MAVLGLREVDRIVIGEIWSRLSHYYVMKYAVAQDQSNILRWSHRYQPEMPEQQ